MAQIVQTCASGDLGNTITKSCIEGKEVNISASKKWCFTLNNYTKSDYDNICAYCANNSNVKLYIVGKEIGESGTPHLQGFIELDKKSRFETIFKNKKIHFEKTKGSNEDNFRYCSKDGDYVTNFKELKILKESQLYDWEKSIIEMIKLEPNDRTIIWILDEIGGAGKTTFAKYLTVKYKAVLVDGKKNDILYVCANAPSDLYLMNLSRTTEHFVSYDSIEKVKDGYYMSAKYESLMIVRNCPHFIVFANFLPDVSKMSRDRWNIYELKDKKLVSIPTTPLTPLIRGGVLAAEPLEVQHDVSHVEPQLGQRTIFFDDEIEFI